MTLRSLKLIIAEVLDIGPEHIDDASGINVTENWDSLNQFMIMSAIEREFDVNLPFDDIEDVANVSAIRSLLQAQGITTGD